MKHWSTRPRRRFPADERANFVALYHPSGLTQSAFARQPGIKLGTLQQWLNRFKTHPLCPRPGFQELMVPLTSAQGAAELRLRQESTLPLGLEATGQLITPLLGSWRRPC